MPTSYASVAAANAPPLSEQPHPDPALLNTTPPSASHIIDETLKVNLVPPTFPEPYSRIPDDDNDELPVSEKRTPAKRRFKEAEAEGIYILDITKRYLLRPGVAGGLVGLANIGLLAGAGCAFYTRPHLRRDSKIIASCVAGAFALFSVEGALAEKYQSTVQVQDKGHKVKTQRPFFHQTLFEHVLRPGTLGGLLGLVNAAIFGAIGYISYLYWGRESWDRRIVTVATVGLGMVWAGEGYIAQWYRRQ